MLTDNYTGFGIYHAGRFPQECVHDDDSMHFSGTAPQLHVYRQQLHVRSSWNVITYVTLGLNNLFYSGPLVYVVRQLCKKHRRMRALSWGQLHMWIIVDTAPVNWTGFTRSYLLFPIRPILYFQLICPEVCSIGANLL